MNDLNVPKWAIPVAAGAAGLAGGFAIGYFFGKRNAEVIVFNFPDEEDEPEETVEVDREDYELVKSEDGYELRKKPVIIEEVNISEDMTEVIKAQKELKQKLLKDEIAAIREHDEEILSRPVNNIFKTDAGENDEWDYEEEMAARKPDEPYVIHKDEFLADEMDYHQETLTYYEGDDIMADPSDSPLWGWFDMIGTLKFGHGSDDPNVVYIRNDALHMEWEVLRHTGRFEVEVGGFEVESEYEQQDLKHSNGLHKFRDW